MKFLANLIAPAIEKLRVEDIEAVKEFVDILLEDLSGLPLNREVEFTKDITPKTTLISNAPHRLTPIKLKDLKD